MLTVKNLKAELFDDISFEVESNQIIAIIGDNGSGKSTLAKTICNYYQAQSGTVSIDSSKIGLLTQNPYLQFIGNTVFDELTYSLEQNRIATDIIKLVLESSPFPLDKSLIELSGGEAQRLLIYKELHTDKEVLILDETLSNLDEDSKQLVVNDLKQSDKAIIFITNNLNDIKYADVVYKLENKTFKQIEIDYIAPNSTTSNKDVSFEHDGYSFRTGLNVIGGASASGKTTLINDICFNTDLDISLIPQYPFEMVTTLNATHIDYDSKCQLLAITSEMLEQNITDLSTGELVKVLVLEALATDNKVLILDESIEVLDKRSQTNILNLVLEHFDTVIIVSHNLYLFNDYEFNLVEVK